MGVIVVYANNQIHGIDGVFSSFETGSRKTPTQS